MCVFEQTISPFANDGRMTANFFSELDCGDLSLQKPEDGTQLDLRSISIPCFFHGIASIAENEGWLYSPNGGQFTNRWFAHALPFDRARVHTSKRLVRERDRARDHSFEVECDFIHRRR